MNRGVITISESGTVSMPTDNVWMTMQEIADMYNVFGCYVRKAVKAIFKDGILKEQGVRRHVRKNDYRETLLVRNPDSGQVEAVSKLVTKGDRRAAWASSD